MLSLSSSVTPSNLQVMLGPVFEALTNAHPLENSALTPSISFTLYPFSLQYSFTDSITLNFSSSVDLIIISGLEWYLVTPSNNSETVLSVLDSISTSLKPA